MTEVGTRKSLLLGLLDLCESAGAISGKVMGRIDQVDGLISAAMPEYLDLRFEDPLPDRSDVGEDRGGRVKSKARTLLWIYLIEWLTVTGIAMVYGFALG